MDKTRLELGTLRHMFVYSDWGNGAVLSAAAKLSDEQLDRDVQTGPGTLRRILIHTYNGEMVWLSRWRRETETRWPDESARRSVAELRGAYEGVWREREVFFEGLDPARLGEEQVYRDSKGSLFRASLGEMIVQCLVHSIHHRSQAVNAIRRVGGAGLELDYMMRARVAGGAGV